MKPTNLAKLVKVLALADSSHDGEAAAAIRAARQILQQNGLNFADLARAATGTSARKQPDFSTAQAAAKLPEQLAEMRKKIKRMQTDREVQDEELTRARAGIARLESSLRHSQAEVEKWRNMARDVANKLWDIGQQIENDRVLANGALRNIQHAERLGTHATPLPPADYPHERRFIRNSLIDAQEVMGHDDLAGHAAE